MAALTPPDSHTLLAAVGWLELGNPREALRELDAITARNTLHPGVLEVRWQALAALPDWAEALRVAQLLVHAAPDQPAGWLHRAYAARRAPGGGLEQARQALLPAAGRFPKEPLIAFNLACYACQLGELPEARKWLRRAFRIGPREEVRAMALQDADLEPLWPELQAGALP
jgi:Flp pilus assembly protein TadD